MMFEKTKRRETKKLMQKKTNKLLKVWLNEW